MHLQKFLASNEKLSCGCEECEKLFDDSLAELREAFPAFDFQLRGVAFVAKLTDTLGVAVNRPRTEVWVARLVVGDQATLLDQDDFDAVRAVKNLFNLLREIQPVLSDNFKHFLDGHFQK